MRYTEICEAVFMDRPNRFVAHVELNGKQETVHVVNTGRCRELLIPGTRVLLNRPGTPGRKTEFDLVSVYKNNETLINIDSMAPNKVVKEWLEQSGYDKIHPEFVYGDSRLDFMTEKDGRKRLLEVKGCTLEIDGIGYFPDAPTVRGVKHLKELIRARNEGWDAAVGFVIQMEGVREVRPNNQTHPEFGEVLQEAKNNGVQVLGYLCEVHPETVRIKEEIILRSEKW